MILRLKDGARYFLAYDAENRLTSVSGTVSASFVYNGDGQRVIATIGATISTYIGGYFEWQAGTGKSYYFAGAQRCQPENKKSANQESKMSPEADRKSSSTSFDNSLRLPTRVQYCCECGG